MSTPPLICCTLSSTQQTQLICLLQNFQTKISISNWAIFNAWECFSLYKVKVILACIIFRLAVFDHHLDLQIERWNFVCLPLKSELVWDFNLQLTQTVNVTLILTFVQTRNLNLKIKKLKFYLFCGYVN